MSSAEIALFPIPELVAFPGTVIPLHVFEPRYRKMVHESVRDERMIGVCHTRKQIAPGKRRQSLEDALATNQATYQPYEVFSAGPCEVVGMTEDGRIHANIHIAERFRIIDETQTLPYRIVQAEVLEDEPDRGETRELQERVNERLLMMVSARSVQAATLLQDPEWVYQSPAEFSFKIFQFLRFDPGLMQTILETRSPLVRLTIIDEVLEQAI